MGFFVLKITDLVNARIQARRSGSLRSAGAASGNTRDPERTRARMIIGQLGGQADELEENPIDLLEIQRETCIFQKPQSTKERRIRAKSDLSGYGRQPICSIEP